MGELSVTTGAIDLLAKQAVQKASLAAELFGAVYAPKQFLPKSPVDELYGQWEAQVVWRLTDHWSEKARSLTRYFDRVLNGRKASPTDILYDDEYWGLWANAYYETLNDLVEAGVDIGVDQAVRQLEVTFSFGMDANALNPRVTNVAEKQTMKLVTGLTKTDKKNLQMQLGAWTQAHEDFPSLVGRVDKIIKNPVRAKMIATTEATRAYARGNIVTWLESDVVNGKQWKTAQDESVCPICRGLHNQVSPLSVSGGPWGSKWRHPSADSAQNFGQYVENPPAHPNCRCVMAPWVKKMPKYSKPTGERRPPNLVMPGPKKPRRKPKPKEPPKPKVPEKPPQFKDLREAEAWMEYNHQHMAWDLQGCDMAVAQKICNEYHYLAQRFPEVSDRINYVGTYKRKMKAPTAYAGHDWGKSTYAHASKWDGTIGLNPYFFGDRYRFERSLKKGTELYLRKVGKKWKQARYHPLGCDTIESVVTHEFGHHVHFFLTDSRVGLHKYVGEMIKYLDDDGLGRLGNLMGRWQNKHKATWTTSVYGTTNIKESFAEGFTALRFMPPDKWPKYVKDLDVYMKTVYKPSAWVANPVWMNVNEMAREEMLEVYRYYDRLREALGLPRGRVRYWDKGG
jgi:hypothetical protein